MTIGSNKRNGQIIMMIDKISVIITYHFHFQNPFKYPVEKHHKIRFINPFFLESRNIQKRARLKN